MNQSNPLLPIYRFLVTTISFLTNLVEIVEYRSMITVSVKAKYGLLAIFELGKRYADRPVQIREIAQAHQIPQSFLEQLLIALRRGGFVRSFRGSQGGYELAQPPECVRVLDVLQCLEGDMNLCGHQAEGCLAFFWQNVEAEIKQLCAMSVAELIEDQCQQTQVMTYAI